MGNFNSNRSDRSRPNPSRGSEGPQMHQAECSKCGKSCLVPFKPNGNRPIFCSECFKTESGQNARRTDDRAPQSSGDRKMYDAVCDSCGNRCQIPFQPRSGKPVYCSHCFEQREKDGKGFRERPQNNDLLASLHIKLDKILALLSSVQTAAPVSKTVKVEKAPVEEKVSEEAPTEAVVAAEEKPAKKTVKKAATKKKPATKKKA